MNEWDVDEAWAWIHGEEEEAGLEDLAEEMSELFFLSEPAYFPNDGDDYDLGYLDAEDWWPLVNQLHEADVDLDLVLELAHGLDVLLGIPGVPTEALEDPLGFLQSGLEGNLPLVGEEKRVGSRRLVKLAALVVELAQELAEPMQAAIQAWANVHRNQLHPHDFDHEAPDLDELLADADLPPAVIGFSMMIGLTLMLWPERAEGVSLPDELPDPDMYTSLLDAWETLPDNPSVTEEGFGGAEALFAQGKLAHTLARLGSVDERALDELDTAEMGMAYSRLSRAILWLHNQCRHCPERAGVSCEVSHIEEMDSPVPLLDVASVIANEGRVEGCIYM